MIDCGDCKENMMCNDHKDERIKKSVKEHCEKIKKEISKQEPFEDLLITHFYLLGTSLSGCLSKEGKEKFKKLIVQV